jgi:hypothetical protein
MPITKLFHSHLLIGYVLHLFRITLLHLAAQTPTGRRRKRTGTLVLRELRGRIGHNDVDTGKSRGLAHAASVCLARAKAEASRIAEREQLLESQSLGGFLHRAHYCIPSHPKHSACPTKD